MKGTTGADGAAEQTTDRRAVLRSVAAGTAAAVGLGSVTTGAATDGPDRQNAAFPEPGEIRIDESSFDEEELAEVRADVQDVTLAELETQAVDCSGSEEEDCPPPDGECNCYFECACLNSKLYRRECCCCDDDDRNGCSGWTVEAAC